MADTISRLREGQTIYDDTELPEDFCTELPTDLDIEKFNNGRRVFIKNVAACLIAIFCYLMHFLSLPRIVDVLVETGRSTTPSGAKERHLSAIRHVFKWHYGNVWKRGSIGGESMRYTRHAHNLARKKLIDRKFAEDGFHGGVLLSQYDYSLAQYTFIGALIMYPSAFGINCSKADLDDLVYTWYWIGRLLGIDDANNICIGGYDTANKVCKDIERCELVPALNDPIESWHKMAKASNDGFNDYIGLPLFTVDWVTHYIHSNMDSRRYIKNLHTKNLSLKSKLSIIIFRCITLLYSYVPLFRWLANKMVERKFKLMKFVE